MADLVDRQDDWRVSYANFSPGVSGEVLPTPIALVVADDELLAENASLREELHALRLHLEMAHECCFPKGEGDG
jgi:hypothetical protein